MQAPDSSAAIFHTMTLITPFKQFLPRDGEALSGETSVFLGYNNNFQNYDPTLTWTREGLLRSQRQYGRDLW